MKLFVAIIGSVLTAVLLSSIILATILIAVQRNRRRRFRTSSQFVAINRNLGSQSPIFTITFDDERESPNGVDIDRFNRCKTKNHRSSLFFDCPSPPADCYREHMMMTNCAGGNEKLVPSFTPMYTLNQDRPTTTFKGASWKITVLETTNPDSGEENASVGSEEDDSVFATSPTVIIPL